MSLGARVLKEAEGGDAPDDFQVYADPAGHPFCLCWVKPRDTSGSRPGGGAPRSHPLERARRGRCYGWSMRWVLMYELVDGYLERRAPLRAEHLELARAAHQRGELLLAGALADPYDRALLVFAGENPEPAEQFARADPYVTNGLVTAWTVRQWNEVLEGS